MTLIEAVKFGRRFKRDESSGWHGRDKEYPVAYLSKEDILADDWKLEPEQEQKIELTKNEIDEAWCETFGAFHDAFPTGRILMHGDFEKFCQELGFK